MAAAMIDRLVHHAEVVSLKGDSYRLKDKDIGRVPNDDAAIWSGRGGQFSTVAVNQIRRRSETDLAEAHPQLYCRLLSGPDSERTYQLLVHR